MERIPCQFSDTESCFVFRVEGECYEDTHHLYYPRHDYRATRVERQFRELDENKVRMCRNLHNTEHHIFEPPEKPDLEIMKMAIEEQRNKRRRKNQGDG